MAKFPRRSGILLHPISLPGRFGIGDLGGEAYHFLDFLADAGQTYWQMLPLGPTGYADSPYQTLSAFAGNPMLVSPDKLVEAGLLSPADMRPATHPADDRVEYGSVIKLKNDLLDRAFARFRSPAGAERPAAFLQFCRQEEFWLDDFALFMALKETHTLRPWHTWEPDVAAREPAALEAARQALAERIEKHKFRQWLFADQWQQVKQYANARGIRIIGDIPIFVSDDSADVWANTRLFHMDDRLRPTCVSGVPPDYFSATGQLWGHPLYRWQVMAEDGYAWWIRRFRSAFQLADLVRIDHFRGFHNYWQVPAGAKDAIEGRWVRGPGAELFHAVKAALGDVSIIAEDLGDFDAESRAGVDALQAEFRFPGMKVAQFGFASGAQDPFLPHNYPRNTVAYTGTHDNDTVTGWYQVTSTPGERDYARRYLGRDGSDIAWDMIRLVWASVADTAMTTAQDLLRLGNASRMNLPGTVGRPNWCWRLLPGALREQTAARLRDLTWAYGRVP
ncbi:MAG: 4-alpha-glucanotransferase [Chloroflexi bacterium]|nr:4-alpha-glucanotransferase [Chloroflexota bacterium]